MSAAQPQQRAVVANLEELLAQVDSLRAGCLQIFQGFVDFARSPSGSDANQLSKLMSNNVRFVVKAIKRMSDLGKELQPHFLPMPSASSSEAPDTKPSTSIDEQLVSAQEAADKENKWKESIVRHTKSLKRVFDKQLGAELPLLANIPPAKRLKIVSEPVSPINVHEMLTGNTTQQESLLAELRSSTQLQISPLRIEDQLIGINAEYEGIFKAMLFFQKTKGTKGVQGGFDLDFDNSDGEMDEDNDGHHHHHANNKLLVEFVVVCGVEEEPPRECAPFVSRHRVFQAISAHALIANNHFRLNMDPNLPLSATKQLLTWLEGFGSLYSEPCRGCRASLYYDSEHLLFLPPTWRTFFSGASYHPQCLPNFPK